MALVLSTTIALMISCAAVAQESGWKSLFDGKTLNGWKQLGGKARYQVSNGVIEGTTVAGTPNTFLVTEREYDDFILELEVRIDDTAINSGIQVRSHFNPEAHNGEGRVYGRQVEVDASSRGWAAGIYDEARRGWLYPMSLNPGAAGSLRVKSFNKIRIECIGNEMKTWINGKPAAYLADTLDQSGFIGLQVHSVEDAHVGKKVYFRNIRIKTPGVTPMPFGDNIFVANRLSNRLTPYEEKNGWRLLFDGQSTQGWKSARGGGFPSKGWAVENGALTVLPSAGQESGNGGDIVTADQYSAFDFAFSFRLTSGANSGVKYFVTLREETEGSAIGLEYQVLDDSVHPDAKLGREGNRTLASLYDLIPADKEKRHLRPIGQWNDGRIVVHPNNRVEHFLNGVKVLEYRRGSEDFRNLVAISKYKVWPDFGEAERGHLLLQDHGDRVSFKNLRIKKL